VKYLFLARLFSLTLNLWAAELLKGGISSGGGASIVCYQDDAKTIRSVEMLDSFEAPFIHGITIKESSVNHLTQLTSAINKNKTILSFTR